MSDAQKTLKMAEIHESHLARMSQMTKVKTALDSVRFPALSFQTDKFNSGKTKKSTCDQKEQERQNVDNCGSYPH